MTNLFKRNKTYYIRVSINQELLIYFENQTSYIKSLKTNNIKDATIISKYLLAKFNYIKSSTMILSTKQIKDYIDEFKKLNYDDIINRNSYLSIEQIDNSIRNLNQPNLNIDSSIIKTELHELMQLLDLKYNMNSLINLEYDDIELFIKYISKFALDY